jgi:hypothetical protein
MSLNKGIIKIRSPLNYSLAQALILVIPQHYMEPQSLPYLEPIKTSSSEV